MANPNGQMNQRETAENNWQIRHHIMEMGQQTEDALVVFISGFTFNMNARRGFMPGCKATLFPIQFSYFTART